MAEENADVSTGTVVEAAAGEATPAETVDTANPTEGQSTDTPAVDWDTPFVDFPAEEEVKAEEVSAEVKEGEQSPTPESGEQVATEQVDESSEEEEVETLSVADIDPNKPPRLNRKQKERLHNEIIEPFRDPNIPSEDVFNALFKLDPERATGLVNTAVEKSVSQFPDEWLSQILGEQVTVADVKAKLSNTPTQAQAESDPFGDVEKYLTETYGEAWKDASRDDELLSEDAVFATALRAHRSTGDAKDTEIEGLKKQLSDLKPQIDSIKDAQTKQIEIDQENLYQTSVGEYRGGLEKRSLAKLFEDAGLKASESDTAEVKAIKEYVTSRFDITKSGDFDDFVAREFSDRVKAQTIIQRVDKNLRDAAAADAKAKRSTGDEAQKLRIEAEALRSKANGEQAALTVLHRAAGQEFLSKALAPVMTVLQQNAELKRQLAQTRPELLNGAFTPDGEAWKKQLEEAKDPWEVPLELGATSR